MKSFSVTEAQERFFELLDIVEQEPVRVMENNRVLSVMVSHEDYQAMLAFNAGRQANAIEKSRE